MLQYSRTGKGLTCHFKQQSKMSYYLLLVNVKFYSKVVRQYKQNQQSGLTSISNATLASLVFPRWPQNTMLMKLIRKLINCEMS